MVPINVSALQDYREQLLLAASHQQRLVAEASEWVHRQIRCIDVAMKMARDQRWPEHYPIKYVERSTGRIYAQGHSLQSMPGNVRSAALAGCWDYDISTCQWTILAQMAANMDISCPLTDAYIADKRSLRVKVSEGAEILLSDAKMAITALLFGAQVQRSEKAMVWYPGDLVDRIGTPAALRLSQQRDFMALYAEVGSVRTELLTRHPRPQGRLINALGIQCDREASESEQLAHLLQGAEAAALRAVVRHEQGNVLLCMHDGWVTANPLDVDSMSDHIQAETGYRLEIEAGHLTAPTSDQIKRTLDEYERFSEGEPDFQCPFGVAVSEVAGRALPPEPAGRPSPHADPTAEATLWTSYPTPWVPIRDRLAFKSPRPGWNLPPGSTADYVRKGRKVMSGGVISPHLEDVLIRAQGDDEPSLLA